MAELIQSLLSTLSHLALAGVVLLLGALIYLFPYTAARLPYRNLPGPPPTSFLFGSLKDTLATPVHKRYLSVADQYGPTYRARALLGKWRIISVDPTAISHVLRHTGQFHRNQGFNSLIAHTTGNGVLAVEDEAHRRHRRILNGAFTGTSVTAMAPMFWEEAYNLKKNIDEKLAANATTGAETRLDMLQQYTCTALDIIGRAGFNYRFNSHEDDHNPLSDAFKDMINTAMENRTVTLINNVFPAALNIPTSVVREIRRIRAVVDGLGAEIIANRRAEVERDQISLKKGEYEGKDVISLCLRANIVSEERDRLTEREILGQIGSLMLAGNETSAGSLGWSTLYLTQHPDIQARLREECMAVADDMPSVDELNALPYLDKFVREVLRLDPPVHQAVRTAAVDCIVPLSKPVTGRDGKLMTELRVAKGTEFVVPINNMQRIEEIWGPNPDEFNPDRFDDKSIPRVQLSGVWGGLTAFLGGPHHCLGYRFAVLEIKAVLFVMMRSFAFDPLEGKPEVKRVAVTMIQRPVVIGEEATGMQIPVMVRTLEA